MWVVLNLMPCCLPFCAGVDRGTHEIAVPIAPMGKPVPIDPRQNATVTALGIQVRRKVDIAGCVLSSAETLVLLQKAIGVDGQIEDRSRAGGKRPVSSRGVRWALLIPVHETGFAAVGIILRAFQEAGLQPAHEEAMLIAGLVVDTIRIGAVVDRIRHAGCDEVVHRVSAGSGRNIRQRQALRVEIVQRVIEAVARNNVPWKRITHPVAGAGWIGTGGERIVDLKTEWG